MVERLADILAQHFIGLSFISKAAGAVQTLKKPLADGKTARLPIARKVYRKGIGSMEVGAFFQVGADVVCDSSQPYYDIMPNTDETGIMYFEDLGAKATANNARFTTFTGSLRLVCWLNMKKIDPAIEGYQLLEAVLANLPQAVTPDGYFLGAKLKTAQIAPKRPTPFDIYDLNEAQRQFANYPYDYFSATLEFVVIVSNSCAANITLNPITC